MTSVKEEEKEHTHTHFGDAAQLYHSHHSSMIYICLIKVMSMRVLLFSKVKN